MFIKFQRLTIPLNSRDQRVIHMMIKRILSFLAHGAFNLAAIVLLVHFTMSFTGSFFETGKSVANDLATEIPEKEITITVEQGATISDIAEILEENEIIQSALFFRLECLLKGNNPVFDEGEVTLKTEMSTNEMIYALLEKPVFSNDVAITILEGYTVKDIGIYLESLDIVSAEEFITACNEADFNFSFMNEIPDRENRLEGYLFPDTYYVAENTSAEAIVNKLLIRFDEIYSKYADQAREQGLTMDEVITIASLIEKEIKVGAERPLASQVIYNRLESGQKLEMCSTILYVLDKRKDRLYEADLQVESPYNTYIHSGLPIGPIANPGEACISAALNPSEGNLLYFVVKDEETGEHEFTVTYDDFLAAKARYNQKF